MSTTSTKTIAQAAVQLFMAGSLAEARQILEIGEAIVEQREKSAGKGRVLGEGAGTGPVGVVAGRPRGKPGPKPRAAAPVVAGGEPPAVPEAPTAPVAAPPIAPAAASDRPIRRRVARSPVAAASSVEAPASSTAVVELPPQDVDPDFDGD